MSTSRGPCAVSSTFRPNASGSSGWLSKKTPTTCARVPVVALLETLIGKGRSLRVFDPQIRLDQIYGSNQRFILNAIPHIGRLLDTRFEDTLAWAEHLVIAQKPSPACAEQIRQSGLPVLDLTV